ncbi:MAG: outer membrane lipoprotein chaperone LolA, partial [Pseudomonadota bacterium]|nr:outer membrane lipoprotein chaperone LolA [Pseudomonadota bacterium]
MITAILVWLLAPALPASAAEAPWVDRYFRGLQSLEADFVQQVFDADDRLMQTSSGHLVMQRPGRFRWDYTEPYQQLIVADGERLWVYDVDLEQVTVRPLGEALGATPLALLSGTAPIEDTFTVAGETTGREGWRWYELHPKDPQSEFQRLRIAFNGPSLQAIELEDALNQRTRLEFRNVRRDVAIDAGRLRFT